MKYPPFSQTVVKEVLSVKSILWTFLLAVMYIFSLDLLLNYRLIAISFTAPTSPLFFLSLIFSLFLGSFTSMGAEPLAFGIFLLNALLVGLNLVLLWRAFAGLQRRGKVHISLGGATLFSLVTAGCASCGLSLLSVLGLSATLVALPFHGAELRYVSLVLLVFSAFYMLKKVHEEIYCKVR